MKIAIIGSGISGSTAAWLLSQPPKHAVKLSQKPKHPTDGPDFKYAPAEHEITVYEKNTRAGGRINTVTLKRSASQSDFSLFGSMDNLASIASASVTSNNGCGLADSSQLESLISRLGQQGTASATGTVTARSLHSFPSIELNSSVNVDIGFQVFNEYSSPNLLRLLRYLGIDFEPSDNSQSINFLDTDNPIYSWDTISFFGLFGSSSLGELLRKLMFRPSLIRLAFDILRFNCTAADILSFPPLHFDKVQTIGQYVNSRMYSKLFIEEYLKPLAALIPGVRKDVAFEENLIEPLIKYLDNHGLLGFDYLKQGKHDKRWLMISNGASSLIDKLLAPIDDLRLGAGVIELKKTDSGVKVYDTNGDMETFDLVICATHADETLEMLGYSGVPREEYNTLRSVKYRSIKSVLHADSSFMPCDMSKWSSWNILKSGKETLATVNLNKLENVQLGLHGNVFLTLDPPRPPKYKFADVDYTYMSHTPELRVMQRQIEQFNDIRIEARKSGDLSGHVLYLGSWLSYGEVEDGILNAIKLTEHLGVSCPFSVQTQPQKIKSKWFSGSNVLISLLIVMMTLMNQLFIMFFDACKSGRNKVKNQ